MPPSARAVAAKKYSVGQRLIWDHSRAAGGFGVTEVIVRKTGTRWVYFSRDAACAPEYRFDPLTGHVDGNGYASPGRIYDSRDRYETSRKKLLLWDAIRVKTRGVYGCPPDLTLEDLIQIARLLKMTPVEDPEICSEEAQPTQKP